MFGKKKAISVEEFAQEEKTIPSPIVPVNRDIPKLKRQEEKPKEVFPLARVHSIEQVGDGIYKYELIVNTLFAKVGDEFEI